MIWKTTWEGSFILAILSYALITVLVTKLSGKESVIAFAFPNGQTAESGHHLKDGDYMKLQIGIAKGKITPKMPVDLGGFSVRINPSSGVLDDIWARSIFLSDGQEKLAIVSVEIIGTSPKHVANLKNRIKKKCGLKESQILLTATHTHSAPIVDETLIGCGIANHEYTEFFDKVVIETCCKSMENIVPCQMYLAVRNAPNVSYNRRTLLKDGKITLDEVLDESLVERRREVDDSLQTITFIDSLGRRLAKIVHFACHGVCFGHENTKISSDLPGWVSRHIEESEQAKYCIFLNGACGDINPVDHCTGIESLKRDGYLLVDAIKRTEETGMELMKRQGIQIKITLIEWPFIAAHDIDGFEKLIVNNRADISDRTSGEGWDMRETLVRWAKTSLEKLNKGETTAHGTVHDITLGTVRFVGLPFEVFSDVQKLISQSKKEHISVVSFANGVLGYFPDPEEYKLGGYEVAVSYVFYNQIGCLDPIKALKLLQSTL